MKQMKVFLIALLTIFVGSTTAQTTSVSTIIVNDTTIADATSLADAIQKAGITDSTKVTSIHYTKGVLVGSYDKTDSTKYTGEGDWATIRTLDNLESLITDEGVVVTDIPAYEFYNKHSSMLMTDTYILCQHLTTVKLATVKIIGQEAFYGQTFSTTEKRELTTIDMPAVETVGEFAFWNCPALNSVSLPKVTTIGDNAFGNCFVLGSVSFPEVVTIGSQAFFDCKLLKTIQLPKVVTIGNEAFAQTALTALTSDMIRKVTTIGDNVFKGCQYLKSVSLSNVDSLGYHAFNNCISLSKLSLPKVATINGTFEQCLSLTSVELPVATAIGESTFAGCIQLSSVSASKATELGSNAFQGCSALKDVSIPMLQTIGEVAFKESGITKVSFPEVTEVRSEAFSLCDSLVSVSLPKAKIIRWGAFGAVGKSFTSITLPSADTIEYDAFKNSGIKHADLPAVKFIGDAAFQYCYSLSSVSLPAVPPTCGKFSDSSATLLIVDANDSLLKGDAFTSALEVYKKDRGYSATTGKWNGLKLTSDNVPTAIESVNAGLTKIWSEGGSIYVSTPAATNLTVVSAIGRMIRMSAVPAGTTTIGNLSSGIYFVRLGNETRKIAVK